MDHRSSEIAKRMPIGQPLVAVEVGVKNGKNAEKMLTIMPDLKLFLVDTWEKPLVGSFYYNSGDGVAAQPPGFFKKAFRETRNSTVRFGSRAVMMKMASERAASQFTASGDQFDFVFLDADHSYEGVTADILQWWPLIKKGGYLCGHDYDNPRIGEVKRAVDERFGSKVELGRNVTWFVRKSRGPS